MNIHRGKKLSSIEKLKGDICKHMNAQNEINAKIWAESLIEMTKLGIVMLSYECNLFIHYLEINNEKAFLNGRLFVKMHFTCFKRTTELNRDSIYIQKYR